MTNPEILKRAQEYMTKLAGGIDPLTDTEMPADTVLNNVRLSRCFFYVADILKQVIDNGGAVGKPEKVKLLDFAITEEQKKRIQFSENPLALTNFLESVNAVIDQTVYRKITYKPVFEFLAGVGYLAHLPPSAPGKKARKVPTTAGNAAGITQEERSGQYGSYLATVYNKAAQSYIVDNLDKIIMMMNAPDNEE